MSATCSHPECSNHVIHGSNFCSKHLYDRIEEEVSDFMKFDGVKTRLELLEPEFIKGIGKIITFGAEKYSANNWKKARAEDIDRIKGALYRHWLAYLGGEKLDPETGESHLYHIGCNLMFLDYFDRTTPSCEVIGDGCDR